VIFKHIAFVMNREIDFIILIESKIEKFGFRIKNVFEVGKEFGEY